jgi:AraC-like DNA-binding protein
LVEVPKGLNTSRTKIRGRGRERRSALVEEALAVIDLRLGDADLSVGAIAGAVYASPRQLHRAFAESGSSVWLVVRQCRMERAAELLVDYRLSIGDVGRRVGYRRQADFAQAFRAHHGCSPREWRRTGAT